MTRTSQLAFAIAALLAGPIARADGFSTTNLQLLQGYKFADPIYNANNGPMTTLTLNHFDAFGWGDSFVFFDLYRANFSGPNAVRKDDAQIYAEWHPRLFVNQLLRQQSTGIPFVRNWGLAGEINQGSGDFYAYLAGVGFDFDVPLGYVLGLNVYYRYDRFAYHQWQVSPFWTVPFAVGNVPFLFTGFVDVNGSKTWGDRKSMVEVWAQPELLFDLLAPFGGARNKLYAGVEWFYHRSPTLDGIKTTSTPQIMAQWVVQ
jgi:nucleoside-specific outer membrane channel protein Tsx